MYLAFQSVLAGRTTGLVVDIGDSVGLMTDMLSSCHSKVDNETNIR